MQFIKFADNRFQEITVEMGEGSYSPWKDGEGNAIQFLVGLHRFFFKVIFIPKVIFHFFLVKLNILPIPIPKIDILKAQHENADYQKKTKQAKKVGINPDQIPVPKKGPSDFN